MNSKKYGKLSIRIGSIVIDHVILTILMGAIFLLLGSLYKLLDFSENIFIGLLFSIIIICILCKDIFGGQSFGKKIMNIKIIDIKTGKEASKLKTIVRNLFLLLWPVELIFVFKNNERRLGDKVVKTKLVYGSNQNE